MDLPETSIRRPVLATMMNLALGRQSASNVIQAALQLFLLSSGLLKAASHASKKRLIASIFSTGPYFFRGANLASLARCFKRFLRR